MDAFLSNFHLYVRPLSHLATNWPEAAPILVIGCEEGSRLKKKKKKMEYRFSSWMVYLLSNQLESVPRGLAE
jgi:hypothetical protein